MEWDLRKEENEIARRLTKVGEEILVGARNELYIHMRFLDVALSSFYYQMDSNQSRMGTDGNIFYFNPGYLGALYQRERIFVNRLYLHSLFHCLFLHIIVKENADRALWDLACDIAAESVIDSMKLSCVQTGMSWKRESTYQKLEKERKVFTAQGIYESLKNWKLNDRDMEKLVQEFYTDDHNWWMDGEDSERKSEMSQKWDDIKDKMEMDLDTFSKESVQASGGLREQLKVKERKGRDYRSFLRKFSVLREEIRVDTDQFDYSFYSYGLSLYGNMPLIEPVESKEVMKVEELAIVLDTSMSCSGRLIRLFLEETFHILRENDSFFRKLNLHIIQCDEKVQRDAKITCEEELLTYMEELEIVGSGGTDFRPAFDYVEKLRSKKEFTNLKGLLYFTDGYGIYPKRMPSCQTAFIFIKDDYDDNQVPPWAIKIVLDEEELESLHEHI